MRFGGNDGKILVELADKKNWRPSFSKIARKLKLPVSTVYDKYRRLSEDSELECKMHVRLRL